MYESKYQGMIKRNRIIDGCGGRGQSKAKQKKVCIVTKNF